MIIQMDSENSWNEEHFQKYGFIEFYGSEEECDNGDEPFMRVIEFPSCCGLRLIVDVCPNVSWYKPPRYDPKTFKTDYDPFVLTLSKREQLEKDLPLLRKAIEATLKSRFQGAGFIVNLNDNQMKHIGGIFKDYGFKLMLNGAPSKLHGNDIYTLFYQINPTEGKEVVVEPEWPTFEEVKVEPVVKKTKGLKVA